jgi:hypothetical protein
MNNEIHCVGDKFQFAVPDAHRHENEVRNFILVSRDYKIIGAMYCNNECDCRDGWIKFDNIPYDENTGLTTQDIINFLENCYSDEFNEQTFKWI